MFKYFQDCFLCSNFKNRTSESELILQVAERYEVEQTDDLLNDSFVNHVVNKPGFELKLFLFTDTRQAIRGYIAEAGAGFLVVDR